MQDFMRKHRKLILVLILIFIGIPFVFFFGMPTQRKSAEAVDTPVMQVAGVPITESQFRRALDATAQQMARRGGQRPTYEEMDAAGLKKKIKNLRKEKAEGRKSKSRKETNRLRRKIKGLKRQSRKVGKEKAAAAAAAPKKAGQAAAAAPEPAPDAPKAE